MWLIDVCIKHTQWQRWTLKTFKYLPPFSTFMMTLSNGNIFRVTGPLWGESAVTGGFPHKGQWRRVLVGFFHLRVNKPWANNCDLKHRRAHCDVTVMFMRNATFKCVNFQYGCLKGVEMQWVVPYCVTSRPKPAFTNGFVEIRNIFFDIVVICLSKCCIT